MTVTRIKFGGDVIIISKVIQVAKLCGLVFWPILDSFLTTSYKLKDTETKNFYLSLLHTR